jgi:N-acetylmuramic acid 6-phosphate etherase
MSDTSNQRSEAFLKVSSQFKLGALTTESSHPVTANLSNIAKTDVEGALGLLFQVDEDVSRRYGEFVESGRAAAIRNEILHSLRSGGRLFFTGCGSTGRLSIQLAAIWREFWQQQGARGQPYSAPAKDLEDRAWGVMAGGDYALIKAVEGFEDFSAFGRKQIADLGVSARDVVFAITEGGETSFVIGTAWQGVEAKAKVYFVYNNPDAILCGQVERSRQIIEDPRVEKINLTTGPMAITGSTRMQATSIQLLVLLTVLEMAVRELLQQMAPGTAGVGESEDVPAQVLRHFTELQGTLRSKHLRRQLARLTGLEESVYAAGHKNNYFASRFGIDVLTDTTERSPTYCTPPFRKCGDTRATASWAFLFVPGATSELAWQFILKRRPNCLAWTEHEARALVPEEKLARTCELLRTITHSELMRFEVGIDGLAQRPLGPGDAAVGIVSQAELSSLVSLEGFHRQRLEAADAAGARIGLIYVGSEGSIPEVEHFLAAWGRDCTAALLPVPKTALLLDGVTRVAVKMMLNALSTCTMVRLGRVMGNYMIWVVPSNLKLIDRATRYIQNLTELPYAEANRLLFEVIEYVEPRMKADQAYPPVVAMAVLRHRQGSSNELAEDRLRQGF